MLVEPTGQIVRTKDDRAPASPHRWPLAGQQAEFASLPGGSSHAGVGRDLFGRLGRMGLHTLALTLRAVLRRAALRTGRLARPDRRPAAAGRLHRQGHARRTGPDHREPRRGDAGAVLRASRPTSRYPVHGDIYLQGALLMTYSQGQWNTGRRDAAMSAPRRLQRDRAPAASTNWCGRRSMIEGLDRDELFYVAPYVPLEFHLRDQRRPRPAAAAARRSSLHAAVSTIDWAPRRIVDGKQVAAGARGGARLAGSAAPNARRRWSRCAAQSRRRWPSGGSSESGLPAKDRVGPGALPRAASSPPRASFSTA